MAAVTKKKPVLPEMIRTAEKILRRHPDLCSISINTAADNISFDLKQFVQDVKKLERQLDAPRRR